MKRISTSNLFGLFVLVIATIAVITITIVYHAKREYAQVNDMTQAHVSIADSIAFEYAASLATVIDMPEELPATGDTMCAYVNGDTIYVEYYHGHPEQQGKFVYLHNY